jgi:spermidine synthase
MPSERGTARASAVPLLSGLVFLSGASALIYQLLWLRLLGLVFGVTVHAASTVLASFMAGLALGSYATGRLAPRIRRPLLWFAAAESLIAMTALLTPWALDALQVIYRTLHQALPQSMAALTVARFATSFLALILPTSLMGATLPIVMKSALVRSANSGNRFGLLYAANTTGAIGGALAAGLWLIPSVGIRLTFVVAAASNLAAAAVALLIGRTAPALTPDGDPVDTAAAAGETLDTRARQAVLAVFALSGFTSLALEVVWFRVNVLVLRPTVYTFAMMLATILAGIALGSAMIAPFMKRRRDWLTILAAVEFLIAIAVLFSFQALEKAPPLVELGAKYLTFIPGYLIPLIVTSAVTIFPAMLLMGAAFPVGLQVWSAGAADAATVVRRVGTFSAVNVTGAILGSIAAGFLLLPQLGSRKTLLLLTAMTAAGAALLLVVARAPLVRRAAIAAVAIAALLLVRVPDPFDVFLAQRVPEYPLMWRQEGVQTTVSVHRFGHRRVMFLDGLHQASTISPLVLEHRRIGHLGPLLHQRASDILVIGLGGGATAGAASQYPYAHTEVVELSRAVINGASFFSEVNYDVLHAPNVALRVDDGRNHLKLSGRRYDVIMADIIQPIHAGAGNVYSAEYFSLVRSGLRDGGLAVQWVFGTDAEYKMIMRTFLSVFPHVTLWADGSVMVGSLQPLRLNRADIEWKLAVPQTRDALRAVGINSFEDLQHLYTAGDAQMRAFVGPGPILTDDRPAIEYFLSLPRHGVDISTLRSDPAEVFGKP